MRQLTFKGFLKKYVHSLSYSQTNSIYHLVEEALAENPRLREPLFLYALFSEKSHTLLNAARHTDLFSEYEEILSRFGIETINQALANDSTSLPERYRRVYKSYLALRDRTHADNHTKILMHNRIVRLQNEKGISTYRIYKNLGLNHGNTSAFIKHGSCEKLSLENTRRILAFVESL